MTHGVVFVKEQWKQRPTFCGNVLWLTVWALACGKLPKQHVSSKEYQLVVKDLVKSLPREELEEWALLSWSIWNAQNSFIHEKSSIRPMVVYEKSLDLLKDFKQSQVFQ